VWKVGAWQPLTLAPLIDITEGLVPPPDLGRRIADNIAREPVAAVRLGNVRVLAREFRDHPATRATLVAGLNDAADEVRIEAAKALGDDGVRTLLKVALSSRSQDSHAAQAIAALPYHRFRPRHAAWLLRRASEARRVAVLNACLERLIINCDERSASALSAALWSEDDEVALAASRVLKDGGTARFEGTLIQALTHRLVDVQRDAVIALGRIGTVESVAPLAEWDVHHALDRFVRADARRAIAAIQSRQPGASPGQLSLAGTEAGQVSLAGEDQRGQVSLEGPSDKSGS
jgi:HEAT repeat protein